jgi:hypothetical protein
MEDIILRGKNIVVAHIQDFRKGLAEIDKLLEEGWSLFQFNIAKKDGLFDSDTLNCSIVLVKDPLIVSVPKEDINTDVIKTVSQQLSSAGIHFSVEHNCYYTVNKYDELLRADVGTDPEELINSHVPWNQITDAPMSDLDIHTDIVYKIFNDSDRVQAVIKKIAYVEAIEDDFELDKPELVRQDVVEYFWKLVKNPGEVQLNPEMDTVSAFSRDGNETAQIKQWIEEEKEASEKRIIEAANPSKEENADVTADIYIKKGKTGLKDA